jgi:hypothetical protein
LEKANLADKGFLDVPIWEILDAPSNDAALERLSEFLLQVRTQCDGVVKLTTYVGEMNDITALLNGLADRGGNGWITFVDDTIEGIVGKARNGDALPLLEVPVGGDAPPPGIVYVTRQAGGSDAIDLDGLFGKLTDGERSGLLAAAPGGGDATRLQLAPAGVKLGFPVFVGYDLASTHLPSLSAKLNNHSGLVACASGKPAAVATGNLSRTLAMLMQQELDVIATEMETAGVVWKRYLTQRPDVLRTVIQSKLISVAIAHRQELVTAHGGNPNYKECLVAARVEIERLLGRFDLLERGLWVAAGDKWVEVGRTADGLAAVDKQFAIAVPAKAQSSEPKPTPTEPFQTDLIFGLL